MGPEPLPNLVSSGLGKRSVDWRQDLGPTLYGAWLTLLNQVG